MHDLTQPTSTKMTLKLPTSRAQAAQPTTSHEMTRSKPSDCETRRGQRVRCLRRMTWPATSRRLKLPGYAFTWGQTICVAMAMGFAIACMSGGTLEFAGMFALSGFGRHVILGLETSILVLLCALVAVQYIIASCVHPRWGQGAQRCTPAFQIDRCSCHVRYQADSAHSDKSRVRGGTASCRTSCVAHQNWCEFAELLERSLGKMRGFHGWNTSLER